MKTYNMQTDRGSIDVELRKHHFSKQLRLSVRRGKVLVTLPKRYPYRVAEQFARSKKTWIAGQLASSRPLAEPTTSQRQQAANLTKALVEDWADTMNFNYSRISIRNQSTRWGSCSTSGTLSFNWRILLLPKHLQDYLVIHELAHVSQPNHSKKFWQIVARFDANYTSHRRQLRQIDLAEIEG